MAELHQQACRCAARRVGCGELFPGALAHGFGPIFGREQPLHEVFGAARLAEGLGVLAEAGGVRFVLLELARRGAHDAPLGFGAHEELGGLAHELALGRRERRRVGEARELGGGEQAHGVTRDEALRDGEGTFGGGVRRSAKTAYARALRVS